MHWPAYLFLKGVALVAASPFCDDSSVVFMAGACSTVFAAAFAAVISTVEA